MAVQLRKLRFDPNFPEHYFLIYFLGKVYIVDAPVKNYHKIDGVCQKYWLFHNYGVKTIKFIEKYGDFGVFLSFFYHKNRRKK